MKKNPEFTVETKSELLAFLLERFSSRSRNYVKGILKRGQVTVDGKVRKDYALELRPGQRVEVLLQTAAAPKKLKFPVIYEDGDIIVIDKPAGMLPMATDKEHEDTAYHILTDYVRSRDRHGRVFIVHRLDRETSGVMLLAKSERIKRALQENWDDNAIRRGYTAVVEGKPEPRERRIVSWLKQTKTLLMYSSGKNGDGKMAVTNYRTLQTSGKYSLLDISLETGRKNQIRVHMKDIGHSVAGDKKYGALTDPFKRLGLHASVLVVRHPFSGEEMRFESVVPHTFFEISAENSGLAPEGRS